MFFVFLPLMPPGECQIFRPLGTVKAGDAGRSQRGWILYEASDRVKVRDDDPKGGEGRLLELGCRSSGKMGQPEGQCSSLSGHKM